MSQTVEIIARFFRVGVPVVEKEVVQHSCARRGNRIQMEKTAPAIVAESHVETVLIAVCMSVVRVQFHAQHHGMARNVLDAGIEIIAPVSL